MDAAVDRETCANCLDDRESCAICLDGLYAHPVGVCVGLDRRRTCPHYFHIACLRRVEGAHCPQCRLRFRGRAELPRLSEAAKDGAVAAIWCRLVSQSDTAAPTVREVTAALKATSQMEPESLESFVESSWSRWAGLSQELAPERLPRVAKDLEGSDPVIEEKAPPVGPQPKAAETDTHDGDQAAMPQDGKAVRGDRVQRGPGWQPGDNSDGGAGQLGTIVRVEGAESHLVFVKWDRGLPGEVCTYSWDPEVSDEFHAIVHASFRQVPEDTQEVQGRTGLSSLAAEALMRQWSSGAGTGHAVIYNLDDAEELNEGFSETSLRGQVQLFHRIRVLPDCTLVQDWFDASLPCSCARAGCRGGVQWSSNAESHLGREGYVLQIDDRDDSVLVETTGRCNCKLWFPRLAVEPVYDAYRPLEPRLPVNTPVECRVEGGWRRGVVERVWMRLPGWGDRPTAPYSVQLEDGSCVVAPRDCDSVIRRFVPRDCETGLSDSAQALCVIS